MGWFQILIAGSLIFVGGMVFGYILRNKDEKHRGHLVKYSALTPHSRNMVDGYTDARMVDDERTTFKERR